MKPKILLAADEFLLADLISGILLDNDFEIYGSANTVTKCMAMIEKPDCCAAILDFHLRNETTIPIAEKLKKQQHTVSIFNRLI